MTFTYSREVRPADPQCWWADISRLRSLGYAPRVGLAAGLDATVAWFKREGQVELEAGPC